MELKLGDHFESTVFYCSDKTKATYRRKRVFLGGRVRVRGFSSRG